MTVKQQKCQQPRQKDAGDKPSGTPDNPEQVSRLQQVMGSDAQWNENSR
ncbi:hypothetical protein ACNPKL_28080 [Klebsiella pneumoniae]